MADKNNKQITDKYIIWTKIWQWIKENRLTFFYFFFALIIEMVAVFSVEGNPFLSRPFIFLGVLLMFAGIGLIIPSQRVRFIVYAVLLAVQAVLDLVFVLIYDMTGQYFDFAMLSLKNDAFAILESIPADFVTFYCGMFFCALFVVYGLRFTSGKKSGKYGKGKWISYAMSIILGITMTSVSIGVYYPRKNGTDKYLEMIDGKTSGAYSAYGMIGNLVGEASEAIFVDRTTVTDEWIESFIYDEKSIAQHTDYFGVSKGKNVVTVLAESLEWFAFLSADEAFDEYPRALPLNAEQMERLYPNLRKFYRDSLVMSNFHSREKTDISETLSIIGNYPTEGYINYSYEDNTIPYTLPNLMKLLRGEESISSKSFHNGFKTFYNRDEAHVVYGFEGMTDMFDLEDLSDEWYKKGWEDHDCFHNGMFADDGAGGGLRNLDSEMMYTARDLIAPLDISQQATNPKQSGVEYLDYANGDSFYSYITTITMHGVYYERENLMEEQALLEEELNKVYQNGLYKVLDEDEPSPYCYMTEEQELLFHYMVTGINTDKAIGILMDDLQKKGLLDDTIVVLFGDHNAYYHALSNYVKGIDTNDYETSRKFTDLYNVPLMIYDSDLMQKVGKDHIVEKFTCTADIMPTILDLLGINYYSNLYYGNSVLSNKQSVLYSRAYDMFYSDGIAGRSVNNVLYRHKDVTDAQFTAYKAEGAALVEKIKYCDFIFRQDYFGDAQNLAMFQEKMFAINS